MISYTFWGREEADICKTLEIDRLTSKQVDLKIAEILVRLPVYLEGVNNDQIKIDR